MLRYHIMPSLAFCVDDESKEYADIDKWGGESICRFPVFQSISNVHIEVYCILDETMSVFKRKLYRFPKPLGFNDSTYKTRPAVHRRSSAGKMSTA